MDSSTSVMREIVEDTAPLLEATMVRYRMDSWLRLHPASKVMIPSFQRLSRRDALSLLQQETRRRAAEELLNRYNIGQCQAALFQCARMRIEATEHFKEILTYAKLARLLHHIIRVDEGHYVFEFSGPAAFDRDTTRYGASMAKFLPSLLRCKGWRMEAQIKLGTWPVKFLMSSEDKLKPVWAEDRAAFDSSIEESLMTKWGEEPRDGWSLSREREILWKDQHVFTPDFLLSHQDGRKVHLEIAGFWTPEYVEQKRKTLAQFPKEIIVLAVPEDLHNQYADLGRPLVTYKSSILIKAVVDALAGLS